jgi:hypothetical protein
MSYDELLAKIDADIEDINADYGLVKGLYALRAVVELHKPVLWQKIEMVCDGCGMNIEQNYNFAYPCPTIQAIEKGL